MTTSGPQAPDARDLPPTMEGKAPTNGDDASLLEGGVSWRRGPSPKALAASARSLAVMLRAKLPLAEALSAAAEQAESDALREALEQAEDKLRGGAPLSEALAEREEVFGRLYVRLAQVGEETGTLGEVFLRLASRLEKGAALRRNVRTALAYPAVVLAVAAGATGFMLTFIVPTFAEMFRDFNAELPAPTKALLALSGFVTGHYVLLLVGLVGLVIGTRFLLRSERTRPALDRLSLKVPVVGTLVLKSELARLCRTLGTLLESGVPLDRALEVLASASTNVAVRREIERLRRAVSRGEALAGAAKASTVFPPMLAQMIAVGEKTAGLGAMLLRLGTFYEREVDGATDAMTSVLEPLLVVLVGLLIGGILIALYLPMFDLISAVGG